MSLFRTIGAKVKGLLGDEQFFDRLARAQAFADGDYLGAAKIGATLRDSKGPSSIGGAGGSAGQPSQLAVAAPSSAPHLGPKDFAGRLGWIAESQETPGGGVHTVSTGRSDPGGVSYGANQLSSRAGTMGMFLESPEGQPFSNHFEGARPGSEDFGRRYHELVSRQGNELDQAQHDFLYRTHFLPASDFADKLGFDITSRPLQEAIWSMSTQHSPQGWREILNNAVTAGALDQQGEDQLRTLYEQRGNYADEQAGKAAGSGRYAKEFEKARAFDSFVREQSDPRWPTLHARKANGVIPAGAPSQEPVDPGKIEQLQQAFDEGRPIQDLVKLAKSLNLEFTVKDLKELRGAVKYRDAGGKGAMITGPGFNPYGRHQGGRRFP